MTKRKYLRWQNAIIKFAEWNRWHFQDALLFSGRKYWDEKQESWHSQWLFYLIGRAHDIVMGRFQRQKQFCYPTSFKEMLKCILWLSSWYMGWWNSQGQFCCPANQCLCRILDSWSAQKTGNSWNRQWWRWMMNIIDDWQRAGKFRREILNGSEPLWNYQGLQY